MLLNVGMIFCHLLCPPGRKVVMQACLRAVDRPSQARSRPNLMRPSISNLTSHQGRGAQILPSMCRWKPVADAFALCTCRTPPYSSSLLVIRDVRMTYDFDAYLIICGHGCHGMQENCKRHAERITKTKSGNIQGETSRQTAATSAHAWSPSKIRLARACIIIALWMITAKEEQ